MEGKERGGGVGMRRESQDVWVVIEGCMGVKGGMG